MSGKKKKPAKKNKQPVKKPFPRKAVYRRVIAAVLIAGLVVFLVFRTNEDNEKHLLRSTYWALSARKTASGDEVDIREVYNVKASTYQGNLTFDGENGFELWLRPGDISEEVEACGKGNGEHVYCSNHQAGNRDAKYNRAVRQVLEYTYNTKQEKNNGKDYVDKVISVAVALSCLPSSSSAWESALIFGFSKYFSTRSFYLKGRSHILIHFSNCFRHYFAAVLVNIRFHFVFINLRSSLSPFISATSASIW